MKEDQADIGSDGEPVVDDLQAVCEQVSTVVANYARERPEVAALACVGIGFFLGWKLKPW